MATVNTLLSSHVTILRTWTEGGTAGKRLKCVEATFGAGAGDSLVMGGTSNKIKADAFGFTKIIDVSPGTFDNDSKMYIFAPSADGTFIVNVSIIHATDANKTDIVDFAAVANPRTIRVVIRGY